MPIFGNKSKLSYEITALDKSQAAIQSAKQGIATLSGGAARATAAFAGLTGILSTGALTAFVKSGIDAADNLNKLSQQLKVSVEDLSTLKFAATQNNASFEALTAGLSFFQRQIGKSGAEIGNTVAALKEAADRIAAIEDPARQAAEAARLFGRSAGPELLELLRRGGTGIDEFRTRARELGLEISGETGRAADEFKDKLGAMADQIEAAKIAFAGGFIDAFRDFKGELIDRAFIQGVEDLGRSFGNFFNLLNENRQLLATVTGAIIGLRAGLPGAAAGAIIGFGVGAGVPSSGQGPGARGPGGSSAELQQKLKTLQGTEVTLAAGGFGRLAERQAIRGEIAELEIRIEEIQAHETALNKLQTAPGAPAAGAAGRAGPRPAPTAGGGAAGGRSPRVETVKQELSKISDAEESALQSQLDRIDESRQASREALLDRVADLKSSLQTELEAEGARYSAALRLVEEASQSEQVIALRGAQEISDLKLAVEKDHQARITEIGQAGQEELRRAAEENARLIQQPFLNAIDGIQGAFSDAFVNIFSGGVSSFSDLADTVKNIFIRLAAEIAGLMVFRAVLGGIAGLVGGGGAAGGAGGILNALSGASTLSGLAGGPSLGGAIGPSINALGKTLGLGSLTNATLSQLLGGAGLGAVGGGLISGLLGGNRTVGTVAGGALGAGGFALGAAYGSWGGPIGAAIGAILGGVLGGLIKSTPPRGHTIQEIGRGTIAEEGKKGFDPKTLDPLTKGINQSIERIGKELEIRTKGLRYWIGFAEGQGYRTTVRGKDIDIEDPRKLSKTIIQAQLERRAETPFQKAVLQRAGREKTLEGFGRSIQTDIAFKKGLADFLKESQAITAAPAIAPGSFQQEITRIGAESTEAIKALSEQFKPLIKTAKKLKLDWRAVAAELDRRTQVLQQQAKDAVAQVYLDFNRTLESFLTESRAIVFAPDLPGQIKQIRNQFAAQRKAIFDQFLAMAQAASQLGIDQTAIWQEHNRRITELSAEEARSVRGFLGEREGGILDALGSLRDQFMVMVDALKESIFGLKDFRQSLSVSEFVSPLERFSAARAEFQRVGALALGGDRAAIAAFPDIAQTLLGIGRDVFASGPEFAELFKSVNLTLNTVIASQEEALRQREEEGRLLFSDLGARIIEGSQAQIAEIKTQTKILSEELQLVRRELRLLAA